MTNLPSYQNEKYSDRDVTSFFQGYYNEPISYPSNQLDAVTGFFENRGFDTVASRTTAAVLLEQAKRESVNVFKLIDTLKGLSDVELSKAVIQILNVSRPKTSSLGYRRQKTPDLFERRNISP